MPGLRGLRIFASGSDSLRREVFARSLSVRNGVGGELWVAALFVFLFFPGRIAVD